MRLLTMALQEQCHTHAYMDKMFVCPQCGEESDIQGSCPMCGLPMAAARDEDENDISSSFNEEEGGATHDEENEEEDVAYNPYEEEK